MKPWEETWEMDGDGDARRVNKRGERTSLVCLKAASGTLGGQTLISAAPEMARAQLANGCERHDKQWHTDVCNEYGDGLTCVPGCEKARTALGKAGVIP